MGASEDNIPDRHQEHILTVRRTTMTSYIAPSKGRDPAGVLPVELMLEVFSYSDDKTLLGASSVSRAWFRLCTDPELWHKLYVHRGWDGVPHSDTLCLLTNRFAPSYRDGIYQYPGEDSTINWRQAYKQKTTLLSNWSIDRFTNFQLPRPDSVAEGHDGDIYTMQAHGHILVTGSIDKTIRIWNLHSGRLIGAPLVGHCAGVFCLQFDPRIAANVVISGSACGELLIWQFNSGQVVKSVNRAHQGALTCLKFEDSLLLTGSADSSLKIWDWRDLIQTGSDVGRVSEEASRTLTGHCGPVTALDFSGDMLVAASADNTIRIWSVSRMRCVRILDEPRSVACVKLSGNSLISGGTHESLCLYDQQKDCSSQRLHGHRGVVRTVQVRGDKDSVQVIASGSHDGSVLVWTKTIEGTWTQRSPMWRDDSGRSPAKSRRKVFALDFNDRYLAYSSGRFILGLDYGIDPLVAPL